MSIPISQLIPLPPYPLVTVSLFSTFVTLPLKTGMLFRNSLF